MKKILLLPALGAAAALTYGAAAALSVDQNGAPIQVGEDVSVACADSARVAGWGYNDIDGGVYYAWVDIEDANGDCAGNTLYVTPLAQDGTVLPVLSGSDYATGKVVLGAANATDVDGNVSRYKVNFGYTNGNSAVSANNLQRVRLGIDQGPNVGPDIGNNG
jgi:hypothetical protein